MLERLSTWNVSTMLKLASMTSRAELKSDIMHFITLDDRLFQQVRDTRAFDLLDANLQNELTEVYLGSLQSKRKRREREGSTKEFADGQDWARLSCSQLRRACKERGLATGGGHGVLMTLLQAQERDNA